MTGRRKDDRIVAFERLARDVASELKHMAGRCPALADRFSRASNPDEERATINALQDHLGDLIGRLLPVLIARDAKAMSDAFECPDDCQCHDYHDAPTAYP